MTKKHGHTCYPCVLINTSKGLKYLDTTKQSTSSHRQANKFTKFLHSQMQGKFFFSIIPFVFNMALLVKKLKVVFYKDATCVVVHFYFLMVF